MTATALCYPNETVDITKRGYEEMTNRVKEQWNKGIYYMTSLLFSGLRHVINNVITLPVLTLWQEQVMS